MAAALILLVGALCTLALWTGASNATGSWVLTVMLGAGFSVLVVAWIARLGFHNRRRRRLTEMRDSALW